MITCNVMYSPIVGIYLAFLSMDTVRSQDISGSSPLADDHRSLFSPPLIPYIVRGCCVPPVKSLCLISLQQNVSPILAPRNYCPRCTRKLPRLAILCCSCWLRRPSPRPAPSPIPSTTSRNPRTCRKHSRPASVGKSIRIMGRDKQGVL